jgi:Tfp pilus assembly protein FimT
LIEFILVMALLAVVIAIAAPSLSNFFRGRKLESEARRFVALARYGQSQAVSEGAPMMLWMDQVEGTYGVRQPDGFNLDPLQPDSVSPARQGYEKAAARQPTFRLAQNLRFELEGIDSRTNGRVVTIRFLPDGSIDEAALRVLKLLQEDPEKRREPHTVWIAQSWDNTRYEIVDQTNAWQRLSLETSLAGPGRFYPR